MLIRLVAAVVVLSAIAVACGTKNRSDAENAKTIVVQSAVLKSADTVVEGTWTSECILTPSKTTSVRVTYLFTGNQFTELAEDFNNANCAGESTLHKHSGSFEIEPKAQIPYLHLTYGKTPIDEEVGTDPDTIFFAIKLDGEKFIISQGEGLSGYGKEELSAIPSAEVPAAVVFTKIVLKQ